MFKRHVIKELSSYLDNQLAEKEKLRVEAHLKDCEFCQKELSHLRLLSEKLKAWQVSEPGPFFADGVKDEIAHQGVERGATKMRFKKWYIVVPSGVLVGILVLAFMGNYFGRSMMGRLKTSSDRIGKQFDSTAGYQTGWQIEGTGVTSTTENRVVSTGVTTSKIFAASDSNEYDMHGTGDPAFYDFYVNKGGHSIGSGKLESGIHDIAGGQRELVGAFGQRTGVQIVNGKPAYRADYARSAGEDISSEGRPVIVIQPVLPATGVGDKIIRTAEVRLEVGDASQAYTNISAICQDLGGYLAASNFRKDHEGRQAGTITMRIPKDKFLDALNKINALGKVENSSTQSQDVSQEYTNLKNQLNVTMIVYKKMMEALEKRKVTVPEAIYMESELTPVLHRVEGLKNRIDYLNNAISFTTITVHFHEPKVSLKALKDSKQSIQENMLAASIGAIKFLAKAIPVTIAVVIWLAIVFVIVIVLKNWVTRLFKRQ